MRKWLVLALLVSAPSGAFAFCDEWTTPNTILEASFQVLVYLDWQQTLAASKKPGFTETNPLLGKHPSQETINTLIPLGMLAHVGISCWFEHPLREWWQGISVVIEGAVVDHNSRLQIKWGF